MSSIRRRNDARATFAALQQTAALLLLGAEAEQRVALRENVQGRGLLVHYVPEALPSHVALMEQEWAKEIRHGDRRTTGQENEGLNNESSNTVV